MSAILKEKPAAEIHRLVKSLIHNLIDIQDTTGKFLLRLDNGDIVDTKCWNDWEWTQGVGLYGLWKYYSMTDDKEVLSIIEKWFHDRFAEPPRHKNINTMAVFLTLACVYEETGNKTYLPHLETWTEWAMNKLPRTEYGGMQHITYAADNTQQLWDDTLMMTVLPLAKIGKVLNRPHYIDEAKRQFLLHIKYLFDTKTGLFFHGWTFEEGGHNFASALWGRGNSWITIVIPEFIELLDLAPSDPIRIHLLDTFVAQVRALATHQDKSGLWHTVIDDHAEDSYLEASATAGFAYGVMKAVRKGYISKEWSALAMNAIEAVIENIDETGELQKVSFGTPMSGTKQFYKEIPLTSMPYGQAMGMMCLVELLWLYI